MDLIDWQTPIALVIVAVTFAMFVWRHLKKRRTPSRSGCASGCCSATPLKTGNKRPPLS
jgi:hypothetical protein